MEKVFVVKGMMCPHCEAHVTKALLAVAGIESAVASHKEEKVSVKLCAEVSDELIKGVITSAGYEVV